MKLDFPNCLLMQIEMLRGAYSNQELSERMGEITERRLARYVAGKAHLQENEFDKIADALSIKQRILAEQWAASLGLCLAGKDPAKSMLKRAFHYWQQHSRIAKRAVPSSPSPMTTIRTKYADRLPRQTPPLYFNSYGSREETPEGRERFARGYEMLVEFVHHHQSQCDVGAQRGISGRRAAQLMRRAACTWARSEGIALLQDNSVPFKNDVKLVKNLYEGLRFFGATELRSRGSSRE